MRGKRRARVALRERRKVWSVAGCGEDVVKIV